MASEEADCFSQLSYAFLEAGTVAVRYFPSSHLPFQSLGNMEKNLNWSEHQCTVPVKKKKTPVTFQIKAYGKHPSGVGSVCGQLAAALGQSMASPWFSQSKTLLKDWEPLAMKNNL